SWSVSTAATASTASLRRSSCSWPGDPAWRPSWLLKESQIMRAASEDCVDAIGPRILPVVFARLLASQTSWIDSYPLHLVHLGNLGILSIEDIRGVWPSCRADVSSTSLRISTELLLFLDFFLHSHLRTSSESRAMASGIRPRVDPE